MTQSVHLPVLEAPEPLASDSTLTEIPLADELQAHGLRWGSAVAGALARVGGAGPSDHVAVRLGSHTLMIPVLSAAARRSPFTVAALDGEQYSLVRHGRPVGTVRFIPPPRFYELSTQDQIPYFKIATLHARDVLATTVLQNCVRYANRNTSCQFCAIGQSLAARRTIPRKTPQQLAEVAEAAVRLDGVRHMVLTTGTPPTSDRGAAILTESARAISQRVDLPIQAQCEPPDDPRWFSRLKDAGVVTLGMHLEAVTEPVRRRIMPGKAEVDVARYFEAFRQAVPIFGRGQVTTYILAGLGDDADAILQTTRQLADIGVYPFVVPFVPIQGTPLEKHPPPSADFMRDLLDRVASVLALHDLDSGSIRAGCGRCGACSTLRPREANHVG